MEKLERQAGPPLVFDASQKGNWENIRNEAMNGKPFRFRSDILEDPPNVRRGSAQCIIVYPPVQQTAIRFRRLSQQCMA